MTMTMVMIIAIEMILVNKDHYDGHDDHDHDDHWRSTIKMHKTRNKKTTCTQVTVTVAMLYSDAAMSVLGIQNETQMATFIADAIDSSNEALTNSDIPMEFDLVHVGEVKRLSTSVLFSVLAPFWRVF